MLLLQSPNNGNACLLGLAREIIARSMNLEVYIQENYRGPESLRNVIASLIVAPASLFVGGDEDMDRFAATAPVLIVPSTEASPHPRP